MSTSALRVARARRGRAPWTVKVRWVVRRGVKLKRVQILLNGHLVARPKVSARSAKVRLSASALSTSLVRVVATTTTGTKLGSQRVRALCGAKRPSGYKPVRSLALRAIR